MTINVSTHYNKHIKHLDQNTFVYKVKKAFYLLTNQEERLYEVGFSEGFLYAAKLLQQQPIDDSNKKIIDLFTNTNNRTMLQNVFSSEQLINKLRFEKIKQKIINKI